MAPPSTALADHRFAPALQPRQFGAAALSHNSPALALSPLRPSAGEAAGGEPLFKYHLGNLLLAQGAVDEAATAFREVLALRPDLAEAHNNLGIALSKSGNPTAAAFHYLRAIEIAPKLDEAHNNLGCMMMLLGQLGPAIKHYRQAIALNPAAPFSYTNLVLALHYLPGVGNALIADTTRRWTAAIPRDRVAPAWRNSPKPTRRLRLGYVSADFRAHPVAYFIEGVLAAHDRRSVEVFCYGNAVNGDATTKRIAAIADHWRDIAGLSDDEAAERIAADAIDILVDLSGHTAGNRLTLFARKPAPIQCTWLGYVGTTGLAEIDYIVTDRFVLPPEDECFYSERPYRLPNSYLCFTPPETEVAVGELPAVEAGAVTFGCFNNLMKINGPVVDLWSKLLASVPRSRLFLKTAQLGDPTICAGLEREFAARGIARERLVLAGLAPRQELLAAYNAVDIALDPFPFGGGTTTIEALWMGVPVISLRGDRFVGRVGESVLTTVGLPELVAASTADYLASAVALAGDLPRLAALRAGLRERLIASPLCDAKSFVHDLENGYRAMWQAWRRSRRQAA